MRITDNYIFFYKDWPSNFQRTKIFVKINGKQHIFTSTEQAFMYEKAIFFDDYEIANLIYHNDNPNECRKLGRQVHGYGDDEWSTVRYEIFYKYNLLKYTQDKKLQEKLLDPKFDNKIFVEASPIDKIWGIGISENNNPEYKEDTWGRNFLGKILTNIRARIKQNKINDVDWNIYSYDGKDKYDLI